jgi:DNA-binding transcriptional MocR family regulator
MPDGVDSIRLYERALRKGIAVAPGPIFTSGDGFRNCLRLNAAFWSEQVEKAIETLGEMAGSIC